MSIGNCRPLTKRGFTLTEAAIVLGIVGLILGAIWVAASAVYNNMRVSTANKQLMTIVQNVRSLYATSAVMDNATMTQLIQAGVFPGDTNPDAAAGTARNGWGGNIAVAWQTEAIAGDAFSVAFTNVPQEACVNMAVSNSGQGRDAGLIGVAAAAETNGTGVPSTPATAIDGPCSVAVGNTITFTFRLKG